jgi:hypothetical protein
MHFAFELDDVFALGDLRADQDQLWRVGFFDFHPAGAD